MKHRCKICDKVEDPDQWTSETKNQLTERQLCFDCNFWQNQFTEDAELGLHNWAVIDGSHYVILPEDSKLKGFYGRTFNIIFNDGTEVTTHNLWHQGQIPSGYWTTVFPNNAKFISKQC